MAEKIKYIVACTFCEKDYVVEIQAGEEFRCPTCGGPGKKEHAVRVKRSLENVEIELLREEFRKHKLKELCSKKRSVSDIAKYEEEFDDFKFDRIDNYEASMERSDMPKDEVENEVEEDWDAPVDTEETNGILHIFVVIIILILLALRIWLEF